MARLLLLSDTHGMIDPRIAALSAECDYVVHAGDIGSASVLEALTPTTQVIAVRGNNDVEAKWPAADRLLLRQLPMEAQIALPGGLLAVVHGERAGAVDRRHAWLRARYGAARAVVYGHSHRLCIDEAMRPWVLNPGAAGRNRTYGGPSCLILEVTVTGWRVEPHRFTVG